MVYHTLIETSANAGSPIVRNWQKIAKFLGENERKYEIRGYTHDEIRRMLDIADVRYKAIILLLASTGMERDALVKMELKDMEYLKDHNLYKIKVYKKSKYEQICFTPQKRQKQSNYF